MSFNKITVIGASGNLGGLVLPDLLKSNFVVTVGTTVVKSDFSLASLTEILKSQDFVISMLPIVALGDQAVLIEASTAARVKRFIPSEFGSDSTAVPFFEGKQKYLQYLSSKEDVISWTEIITGPFFDWGFFAGLTGFDVASKTVTLIDGGKTHFTTSNAAQISKSIIAVLTHPAETSNKLVFVESFTTTQLEVLTVLEKNTGVKWNVVEKTSEDLRAEGYKALAEGDLMGAGVKLITAAVLGKEALEDHTDVEGGIWNERLGLEGEDLEVEIKRILSIAAAKQ